MIHSYHTRRFVLFMLMFVVANIMQAQQAETSSKDWVQQSNKYTKLLIDITQKYSPESGSSQGIARFDTMISVPTLANKLAKRKETEAVLETLIKAKDHESNPLLKQDLEILVHQTNYTFKVDDYNDAHEVPYLNATLQVFGGLQTMLDDQTPADRRATALVRIRKYAGLEPGYQPYVEIFKARTMEQIQKPDMIYPSKAEIDLNLARNPSLVNGIEALFKKYDIDGYQKTYRILKKQLADYDTWIKQTVLPKARTDFKLAPEAYALALEGYGIDIPPTEVASMAHVMFEDIQQQMKPIAAAIAVKYHLPSSDYREVMRFLKRDQIIGDSIMIVYKDILAKIENNIRDHQLVTLPERPAIIRLASEAETAQQPAPHMVPPPFLNNTGQRGVFVLPLNMPAAPGKKEHKYDDFTFEAAAWTIVAHEARPGHEMQFDKMVEEGVSQARVLYSLNSTNVEGWGLYSESIILPHMPPEGQLVSLDYRLLRAARAFLDPELQAGTITQEQAMDILMNDVVQSHAMAQQEVERYTLRAPGQANSYFYGYTKMIALRKDVEAALGDKFNTRDFHDFILSQGILPPALIREAVIDEFVPAVLK